MKYCNNDGIYFTKESEVNMKVYKQIDYLKNKMISKKEEYIPAKAEDKMFRKCPHCGEVWLKTRGCDGLTYCGLVDED